MRAASFCSKCGEQIKARRSSNFLSGYVCRACANGYGRALTVASIILAAAILFVAGRLSASRKPLQFIGSPVDLNLIDKRPANRNTVAVAAGEPAGKPGERDLICGAPTKSGRPCRRKVKDGGYCWQHRDRLGQKKSAATAR